MPSRCIYCGGSLVNIDKGEHIIPKAIGGRLTLKTVCGTCNGSFAEIDRELCSRSYLSVIASQEIDARLWQAWDVDHASSGLLLEARPIWTRNSLAQYSQIVFEASGPDLRGDLEEILHFGAEDFKRVFVKAALGAFNRFKVGEKRCLHFERIDEQPLTSRGYRFPPRMFSPRTIGTLAGRLKRGKKSAFVIRYLTERDRRFAMAALENWDVNRRYREVAHGIGSALPAFRFFYEQAPTLRALWKMAINLLAHCCPQTPVDFEHFRGVIPLIRGREEMGVPFLHQDGFVRAADIQPISAPDRAHSFRLLHIGGWWLIYSSFFGGRIGSVVRFAGPNAEPWSCADVVAPLNSRDWSISYRADTKPLAVRVEWRDAALVIPTVPMLNAQAEVRLMPRA